MAEIKVSIVIPAYNEEKYIEKCLESLVNQETGLEYEVILIDNNSTDKTYEIASKFRDQLNLKIIKEPKQGRGTARATGFKEASGAIILSGDADTIFYPSWIESLFNAIKGDIVAVTTSCQIVDGSAFTNLVFNFIQPKAMVLYKLVLGHYWLSGFSFGILKSVYEKSGGFDTTLQAQEDLDLTFRVAKLGKIKFINKPVIFSGRRFKNSFWFGIYDYIRSFTEAFILKSQHVYLSNPR